MAATKAAAPKKEHTVKADHKPLLTIKTYPEKGMLNAQLGVSTDRCEEIDAQIGEWAQSTETNKAKMADNAILAYPKDNELVFALIRVGEA